MLQKTTHNYNSLIDACEIIEHLPDVFLLVSRDGRIVVANSHIEKILGWKRDEIIGVELEMLLPPEMRQSHFNIRDKFFKVPVVRDMSQRLDLNGWHKLGYLVPLDIKLSTTYIEDECYGIAILREDTLRRELHEKLEEKNKNLKKLLEEKNNLLGMAAHDLRNPIGVIQSFANIMLSKSIGPLTDDQHEFIKRIDQSSVFMMGLLEDVLDFSTIESGTMKLTREEFPIGDLIKEGLSSNKVHARTKDITLLLEDNGALQEKINGDKNKLFQVMHNMIDNAIKYSENNTVVNIKVDVVGDNVRISVSDQGVGIPEDDLKNLFEPFFRAKNKPTGGEKSTGLGLFIIKRIVEAHKGELAVSSIDGQGSKFSFSLPKHV